MAKTCTTAKMIAENQQQQQLLHICLFHIRLLHIRLLKYLSLSLFHYLSLFHLVQ
jgi:hypothetical protein